MNQTSDHEIISRFRRVKGSGLFELDEISAVTGFPCTRLIPLLDNLESSGEVVRFGHGVYLLKPLPVSPARSGIQYDWQPDIQKLSLLLTMVGISWIHRQTLQNRWQYSETTLVRYLRILLLTGHVIVKRSGNKCLYRRVKSKLTIDASWQQITRRNHA